MISSLGHIWNNVTFTYQILSASLSRKAQGNLSPLRSLEQLTHVVVLRTTIAAGTSGDAELERRKITPVSYQTAPLRCTAYGQSRPNQDARRTPSVSVGIGPV